MKNFCLTPSSRPTSVFTRIEPLPLNKFQQYIEIYRAPWRPEKERYKIYAYLVDEKDDEVIL